MHVSLYLSAAAGWVGWVLDWICSEMHSELMEANSCLTILHKWRGGGWERPRQECEALGSFCICHVLGESIYNSLSVHLLLQVSAPEVLSTSGAHQSIREVLLQNDMVKFAFVTSQLNAKSLASDLQYFEFVFRIWKIQILTWALLVSIFSHTASVNRFLNW